MATEIDAIISLVPDHRGFGSLRTEQPPCNWVENGNPPWPGDAAVLAEQARLTAREVVDAHNAGVTAQILALEVQQSRAAREVAVAFVRGEALPQEAGDKLQAIDSAISVLRTQFQQYEV